MRTIKWLALIGLTACLFSCVWSLQPLFEEKDLVFEPGLVGTWKAAESEDTWTFEKDGSAYILLFHQAEFGGMGSEKTVPGDTVRFEAGLGRLGGHLFLDLIPEAEGNPQVRNDLFNWHFIRAHTVARVWLEKDELQLADLSEDWLERAIQSGKVTIAHARAEDGLVVTASTKELQQLVLKYAEDKEAFPPAEETLHRVIAK